MMGMPAPRRKEIGSSHYHNRSNGILGSGSAALWGYGWCVYYCSYYKGMLSVDCSTNVTVQNSVVSYSQNAGIWVDGDDASLTVTNTTLSDNALANDNYQRFGIYFELREWYAGIR